MPEVREIETVPADFFAAFLGVLADPEGFVVRERDGELYIEPSRAH